MKKYGCIAEFEREIQDSNNVIETGLVGYFGNDKITIKGKLITKGMFPRVCVRWVSDRNNGIGLFGKGLIGYSGKPLALERLKLLPVCK